MGHCFTRFFNNENGSINENKEYNQNNTRNFMQKPNMVLLNHNMHPTYYDHKTSNTQRNSTIVRHNSTGVESEKMYCVDSSPSTFFNTNNSSNVFCQQNFNNVSSQKEINNEKLRGRLRNDAVFKAIAIYDYTNRVEGDVSFKTGDVMILIDTSNNDWWYVKHPKNGAGYAPRNFLAKLDSLESQEWYAGKIQRSLAEKLVSATNYPHGTFLVRKREAADEYALTINDSRDSERFDVKHYKIRPLDNNAGYYITTRKIFPTISDLINYYKVESGGLCTRLTIAAPKVAPVRTDLSHDTQKNWELPREELQLIRKLGDGNFGEVWYGKWRGIVEVAIKTMKPGTMSVDAFLAEAQIMKQCNHPKLVKLYAVCTTMDPYYIITEYMINGSLLTFLRRENNSISIHALVDMCAQVANGMMYLESRKLVHRDLAARNVLVGERISGVPEVKVADFGLARKLMSENIYEAQTGAKFPIKWTAPEAATLGNFTVKSDVWSYGILVYEIFTFGHTPYPGMQNREVIEQLEQGYRMPKPLMCPEPVYEEMRKCWDERPENRPTFEHLFAFFDDYFVTSQPNYIPPSLDSV